MFGLKKKKYLEWYSDNDNVTEETINNFLTPATPKSSCWWSNMKSTINDGFNSQLEYVKHQHQQNNTDIKYTRATAKQCPAINNILMNSYLIKSPADIIITVTNDAEFLYNSTNPIMEVSSHTPHQFHTKKSGLFNKKMNLKFSIPINIKTNNIPWVFMQPMYHNNMWFDVASGVIEGKYTKGQQLNINVLVDIPKGEPVTYEIKAGDELAYMWFPEKVELKHTKSKFMNTLFKRKWSTRSRFS